MWKSPSPSKGERDLGALQVRLTYDPAVLEGKKVNAGEAAANAGIESYRRGRPD